MMKTTVSDFNDGFFKKSSLKYKRRRTYSSVIRLLAIFFITLFTGFSLRPVLSSDDISQSSSANQAVSDRFSTAIPDPVKNATENDVSEISNHSGGMSATTDELNTVVDELSELEEFSVSSADSENDTLGNIPQKWIPDQKILAGMPPTEIDLSDLIKQFDKREAFGRFGTFDRSLLEISVVSEVNENIVIPTLKGNKLILVWPKTGEGRSEVTLKLSYPDKKPVYLAFNVEVWQPHYIWMAMVVIGGLGLFLFGMKQMSEGLQSVAGASLRKLIALFTENRFMAVGIGFLATMLVQSSSVTTVMVVGFIDSQIMTLAQGIGIIMGANIGTTSTGWLLALNIANYGLPIIGISVILSMFIRNERIRCLAVMFLGLGFIFLGLKIMESGFALLRDIPAFSEWIKTFEANCFIGAAKCAMVGCILTMLVQSSAATLGITISLASIGAIEFSTAAAMVLGENIGTTITALLASIGVSTNARRAAYFHSLFNVLGVTWALSLFTPVLLPLVTSVAHVSGTQNVAAGIALTHTLFNVTNTIVFLPFVRFFANLLTKYVKEGPKRVIKKTVTNLGTRQMENPIIGLECTRIEILRMVEECLSLGKTLAYLEEDKYNDSGQIKLAFDVEALLDNMQDEIIEFISEILTRNLTATNAENARKQLRIADELESVSDYMISILKSNLKLHEEGFVFADEEKEGFKRLNDMVLEQLNMFYQSMVKHQNPEDLLREIYRQRSQFTSCAKQLRDRFLVKMSEERYDPQVIVAVNSQTSFYRRIREHIQNIVEAMAHNK